MIETITTSVLAPMAAYLTVGTILFLVLVFIMSFNGDEWKLYNLWLIITWPIELVALSGALVRLSFETLKNKKENKK